MDLSERNRKAKEFFGEAMGLLESKGKDYNPTGVAFEDLRGVAEDIGSTPERVLWVYMSKHVAAVRSYVRNGAVASEPLRKRMADLANFAALMAILAEERAHEA